MHDIGLIGWPTTLIRARYLPPYTLASIAYQQDQKRDMGPVCEFMIVTFMK